MARNGRSSLPRSRSWLEMAAQEPQNDFLLSSTLLRWARSCWGVRIGRSNPLGLAASSTRQRRTKTNRPGQAKPTQRRFAGRGRGCLLHPEPARAGALDLAARRSASLGRSTGQSLTKTNRTRHASGQAYSETLRWAGPQMLVALNTETSILRALNARVRPSTYVYIYIYS